MTLPPDWRKSNDDLRRFFDTLARTVAIDFDGVLHPYTDGWTGSTPADERPTPGAREFINKLRGEGYRIVVFSTRCDHAEGLAGVKSWLRRNEMDGLIDDVTCQKPAAVAYVDDRAVRFKPSSGWGPCLDAIAKLAAGRSHGAAQ